jgi:hypothetical protein
MSAISAVRSSRWTVPAAGRWKIDTRDKPFPAPILPTASSPPILADGKVIVAGGGYGTPSGQTETPLLHRTRVRRRVRAAHRKVLWKYDVGPEPQKLDPPVIIKDARGEHVFLRAVRQLGLVYSLYDADSQTLFSAPTHNAPPADEGGPAPHTEHSCAVIAVDARTGRRSG